MGAEKGRWFCKIEVATPVYAWTRRTANQVSGNSGTITHPHRGGVFRVQTTTVQCSTRTSVGRCAWVTFSESRGGLGHRNIDDQMYVRTLRRKRAVACTKSRSQSRSVSGERLAIVLLFLLVSILVHNCNPRRCVRLSTFVLRPLGPLGYGSQERQGHARLRKRVPGTSSLLTNHGRKRKVRSSHLRRVGCHGRTMVTTQPRRVRHQPKASPPPNRGSDKAAAGSAFCLLV